MPTPPEEMKRRCVRARDVREIVLEEFGKLTQEAISGFRTWAQDGGAMNPTALDPRNDILQGAQAHANYENAERELPSLLEFFPGYGGLR